jgi:hypothetical protein
MKLFDDVPDLDADEARRFWMTPAEAIRVAGMEEEWGDVRKLFANIVDRGHLEFRKPSAAKTAPRHFSLMGAIKFRVIYDLVDAGRDYDCAATVGDAVAALLPESILEFARVADMQAAWPWRLVLYNARGGKTQTKAIKVHSYTTNGDTTNREPLVSVNDFFKLSFIEAAWVDAGEVLARALLNYGDVWGKKLRIGGHKNA